MNGNGPNDRKKNVTGQGKDVYKRGDGLGTGPVGNQSGYSGRPGTTGGKKSGGMSRGVKRAAGGGVSIIAILLAVMLGGGGNLFGGGNTATTTTPATTATQTQQTQTAQTTQQTQTSTSAQTAASALGSYVTQYAGTFAGSNVSNGWSDTANTGTVTTTVASGAREKRTQIVGKGADVVTIMVYMCGTDLESQYKMGTSDLSEMASASIADNVNLIVMTGGCRKWQNNIVSSKVNQIYQVKKGGLLPLVEDAGTSAMTNPDNLAAFIKWCGQNFPANRNELILWDHGGGSLMGYGYDEKYSSSSAMTLQQIDKALKDGGVTFDFIGFDACLMATVETALTCAPYADYLIASEESEPGVGWYYTDWLNKLSQNTSTSTLEIGKQIVDDFVTVCGRTCRGQDTTLSVVDLAELEYSVPAGLNGFAAETTSMIKTKQYQTISNARASAKEFAASQRIDQVDAVDLANKVGSEKAKQLSKALLGAIKYNRTSNTVTNAYGLSIYFPYKRTSSVQTAVNTYQAIGMDEEYTRCIQQFASLGVAGQAASGGTTSPLTSLLGGSYDSASSLGGDMMTQLLTGLLSGQMGGVSGLTGSNSSFLGRSLNVEEAVEYISENSFDASALVWTQKDGKTVMELPLDQWALIQDLELNLFMDDGEGYIDLGMDNVFEIDETGALSGDFDGTWLAIDQQPVAYYHVSTSQNGEEWAVTGRVPVMLNDVRCDLIVVFDNETPDGYIAGARYDYCDGETETIAKSLGELQEGDVIDFLCDYYSYDGEYLDSYMLGDRLTVGADGVTVSYVYVDSDAASATYRFTDLYQQNYWSPEMN